MTKKENERKIIKDWKRAVALNLFDGVCYVCGKRYGKKFHFHHLSYKDGELTYKDFTTNFKYQKYILPIIEQRPLDFELLCHKHHYLVEILKKFKPERLDKLFDVTRRSTF